MNEPPVRPKAPDPVDFGLTKELLTALEAPPLGSRVGKTKFKILYFVLVRAPVEHEVGRLYRRLGYSAVVTKQSRDGGVDVILRAEHGTTIVQCKAHQRKIGVKSFRELYGVMPDFGAKGAILVCLHGATDDARRFIQGKPIRIVMLKDLVQMSRELADDIRGDGSA